MALYGRKQIKFLLHDVQFHIQSRTAPSEGLRFFLLVQIMDAAKKKNGHSDTSSDTAVSLKKGDFNTPPLIHFFKRKTAA